MYLMIRHELSKETKAKRSEVAVAKAKDEQRDAQLQKTSEEPSHTMRTISQTSTSKG
jgi:hypothetical protein